MRDTGIFTDARHWYLYQYRSILISRHWYWSRERYRYRYPSLVPVPDTGIGTVQEDKIHDAAAVLETDTRDWYRYRYPVMVLVQIPNIDIVTVPDTSIGTCT